MNADSPQPGSLVEVALGIVTRTTPNKIHTNRPGSNAESRQHEILIAQRPNHTVYGGYWELPGGKLDPGETVDECVIRELREELGVEVSVLGELPPVVHHYDHASVRLHPRLCQLAADSPGPEPIHADRILWCPMGELENYSFPEANAAIIRALAGALGTIP